FAPGTGFTSISYPEFRLTKHIFALQQANIVMEATEVYHEGWLMTVMKALLWRRDAISSVSVTDMRKVAQPIPKSIKAMMHHMKKELAELEVLITEHITIKT
ncbi:hypothetical protein ABR965_22480, partial [Photorhabdus laumondii]|uniref:hypothetical protein n=1 Tax=Photorhabdus laumondii TaxID=2218628 RepID=UPI00331505A4